MYAHILFTHGRMVNNGDGAPPSHAALPAAHYLKELEQAGVTGVVELYGLLCEYTHPSAMSVWQFARGPDDRHVIIDPGEPAEDVAQMLRERKDLLERLPMLAFNPGIVLLKVLNHIGGGRFATTCVEPLVLDDLPIWGKIAPLLGIRAPA